MHNEVLTWQTVSENPYYEERSCGDAFPQYMISDLGLLYLVQETTNGLSWSKIGHCTNLVGARKLAEVHLSLVRAIGQAGPMEAVEVTPSELSIYTTRPALSNADVPDALRTELPDRVTGISPDQLEFTPPHDLATENAELRARLAAARERVIAIQSNLSDRIAPVEKQEAKAAVQRHVSSMARELSIYLVHGERQGDVEFRVVQAASPESAYSAWREACFQEGLWFPNYFARELQPRNHMQITPEGALLIRMLESDTPSVTGSYAWADRPAGTKNHAGVARIVAYAERVS